MVVSVRMWVTQPPASSRRLTAPASGEVYPRRFPTAGSLPLLLIPGHRLAHGVLEGNARLVAEFTLGLLNAEVKIEAQELDARSRQGWGLFRPTPPRPGFHA